MSELQQVANPLEVRNLSHYYKRTKALSDVSFSVSARSIHGFVGPNGAGKTTTLKIMATLLRVQRGEVRVFGLEVRKDRIRVRRRIGFMPEQFNMYPQMTVFETLDFFSAAYGLGAAERDRVISDVLELTDMKGRSDDLVKSLSRGMVQRLSLARALVNDPELLLLDEPASGLDPRARIELMEILKELRKLGKTVFISSHILSELADLCDSITVIDRGQVKYSGSMAALLSRRTETVSYRLTLQSECEPLEGILKAVDGVVEVGKTDGAPVYCVTFDPQKTQTNALLGAAIQTGALVLSFREETKQLGDAFLELTEPGVPS